jgi:hypothetical protein
MGLEDQRLKVNSGIHNAEYSTQTLWRRRQRRRGRKRRIRRKRRTTTIIGFYSPTIALMKCNGWIIY